MKPSLWAFPETQVAPRFQDIIRQGKVPGGQTLLRHIQSASEQINQSTGFQGISSFVDRYIDIVQRKAKMHTQLAKILSKFSDSDTFPTHSVRLLLQQLAPIEIEYFAASAATKNLAEMSIRQAVRVSGWSEAEILDGCRSAYQLTSQVLAERPVLSNQELRASFNGEATLKDWWVNRLPPSLQSKTQFLGNSQGSSILAIVRSLVDLDNLFDKIIEIKRPFLHDVLAAYRTLSRLEDDWTEDTIGLSIEFILREYTSSISCLTGHRPPRLYSGVTLCNAATIGNKGLALEIIAAVGLSVPAFVALPAAKINSFVSMSTKEQSRFLKATIGDVPDGLIVRSSHADEDSFSESKAGHYVSVKTSKHPIDVVNAIRVVVESGARLDAKPAIIIQKYVPGTISGVAFAQIEGVTVETVTGGAEKCVGGTVTPQSHFFASRDLTEDGENPAIHRVAHAAYDLRRLLRTDVDVEFICDNEKQWIVQCRPITAGITPCLTDKTQ